jgi:hypothetical protein
MRRAGDHLGEARVLTNRGLLHAYAGRLDAAESELRRAERRYRLLERPLEAACVAHNLGFVAARQGDVPAALHWYEQAARALAAQGVTHPEALLDYCESLLRARLVPEARQVGTQAADQLERNGMQADLAEARLLLAEAAMADGDAAESERQALLAEEAFRRQQRRPWAVLARYAWVCARWARGDRSDETTDAAIALAEDLRRTGWTAAAIDASVIAARRSLVSGHADVAEARLRTAARLRRRAPADVRIRAWHAEGLLRWSRGNRRAAESALRAGLRVLDEYQATLGATELRAHASSHARELGVLAVRMALESGDPARVLAWAERSRAAALHLRPVRPPLDADMATHLADLRRLNRRFAERLAAEEETVGVMREQAALEDVIRRKAWHATGFRRRPPRVPSTAQLASALGDRCLVEFVDADGALHVVTISGRRAALHELGPQAAIERELDALRMCGNRLSSRRGTGRAMPGIAEAFNSAAERLDGLLFGSIGAEIGDRPIVVVPTGPLHLVPWPALPSCRGRPVSVSPSAALWLQAASRADDVAGRTVLVGGPNVPEARKELAALRRIYPERVSLEGGRATAKAVLAAIDAAGLAHIAAHGTFRADNPLFSSLGLADGPLTVYDLEQLARAPSRVVLSACNAGVSAVRPGNELLGLAAALFALDTTTLVASVVSVNDGVTGELMVAFHRQLAAGRNPAEALAGAQAGIDRSDPQAVASSCGFVCFGV